MVALNDNTDTTPDPSPNAESPAPESWVKRVWSNVVQLGLNESAMRIGSVLFSALLFLGIVLVMGQVYSSVRGGSAAKLVPDVIAVAAVPTEVVVPAFSDKFDLSEAPGIARKAALHTILPSRGREGLSSYTVQIGDSLFSIAEKFGLKAETILWGNRYTLGDDPHSIYPGQPLIILPVDGTLHRWSAGEGLNGVARFYNVSPETIVNYAGNGLDMATIGDFAAPNIEPDTMLIVPGGYGEFPDWRTPRISRENPASAKNIGPGACTDAYDGVMGNLNFIWPTLNHYLSGYDFSPETNHYGIDLAGTIGDPIVAADNGVVVYAGWNDWGYGEMVVIDHGQGWQSLYAHLSQIDVGCGQEVYQGDLIGAVGDTGNSNGSHLHFELRSDEYGRLNPWNFLQ